MKRNHKVMLIGVIVVVILAIGIIYYRPKLFQTKPIDDRKTVNQVKEINGTSKKVMEMYTGSAVDLHLHKSSSNTMQAKISGKIPKQDSVELQWTKKDRDVFLEVIYKENDIKVEKEKEKEQIFPAKLSLDVFIPSKVYDSIVIRAEDGNVTADIPLHANELKVDTKAGSVNLTNVSGDQVHFKTDTGNIQLKKVKAGYMTLTTWEGSQSLQDFQGGGIKFETHSGDINLNQVTGGMMTLNTKSGNIKVDQIQPRFLSYEITTDTGNVDYIFHIIPTNLYLALTSESGTLKNSLPTKKIEDKDNDYYHIRYIKGTLGNGTGNLVIDTKKGNIDVSLKK